MKIDEILMEIDDFHDFPHVLAKSAVNPIHLSKFCAGLVDGENEGIDMRKLSRAVHVHVTKAFKLV